MTHICDDHAHDDDIASDDRVDSRTVAVPDDTHSTSCRLAAATAVVVCSQALCSTSDSSLDTREMSYEDDDSNWPPMAEALMSSFHCHY